MKREVSIQHVHIVVSVAASSQNVSVIQKMLRLKGILTIQRIWEPCV